MKSCSVSLGNCAYSLQAQLESQGMQTTGQDKEEPPPPRESRWLLGVGMSLELLLIGFAIILRNEGQLQCPSGSTEM